MDCENAKMREGIFLGEAIHNHFVIISINLESNTVCSQHE